MFLHICLHCDVVTAGVWFYLERPDRRALLCDAERAEYR